MAKLTKRFAIILVVLMATSLAYTWLMLHFQTVIPSDIVYSVMNKEWTLDSAFVHRIANVHEPDQRLKLMHHDTIWQLSGAIYAHNNLRKFLSVEAIQIQDHSANVAMDAQIRWLISPSRKERKNPKFFMNEPFAMVYELQWPASGVGPVEFNRIIERGFNARDLRVVVRTNRGIATVGARGYRTLNWGQFVHVYLPPIQILGPHGWIEP